MSIRDLSHKTGFENWYSFSVLPFMINKIEKDALLHFTKYKYIWLSIYFPIYLWRICTSEDTDSTFFGLKAFCRQTFEQHGIEIDVPTSQPMNMLTKWQCWSNSVCQIECWPKRQSAKWFLTKRSGSKVH